jgi:steroid 5-alpha reductase family enzyme|tara:strand:+ start:254 stop:1123 length:870 start_codon:yes stop_codon:yes gene_type:complete
MKKSNSIIGILASLVIGGLILLGGSQGSLQIDGLPLFALCGAIGFVLHWLMFVPAYAFQTEHYFDLTGSISYITTVVAVVMLNSSLDLRDLILCAMIVIWAVRLGSFLFWRIKKDGQDTRFIVMKTQFTWFLMTWTLGGLWVLVTMAAGLAAITSNITEELGVLSYIGMSLWLFGFAVEVTADAQKRRFKALPENKGYFIKSGLWAWSQHPNYFGEITLWFGLALVALPVLSGWQLCTLISPIFVYLLLTKVSGIPLLDRLALKKWGTDPDYIAYIESTPSLVLARPKV